jgi:gamma-glutamyltranspeptidase/glutathione hydrolase
MPAVFWSPSAASRSRSAGRGRPPRRRSSASTSSATSSSRGPASSPRACPGAFGGWLLLLRDFGPGDSATSSSSRSATPSAATRCTSASGDDRLHEELVEGWPARATSTCRHRAGALFRNPPRGDVQAHRRREPWRLAGGRDREGATPGTRDSSPTRSTASSRRGRLLTGADMAAWRATVEPVVTLDYRGLTVCKTQPWAPARRPAAARAARGLRPRGALDAEFVHVVTSARSSRSPIATRCTATARCRSRRCSRRVQRERRALVGERRRTEYVPGSGRLPSVAERRRRRARASRGGDTCTSTSPTASGT